MINGGEEFSCNGLIPVKSSCIDITPVKELGPGGHVFPGRSSEASRCLHVHFLEVSGAEHFCKLFTGPY